MIRIANLGLVAVAVVQLLAVSGSALAEDIWSSPQEIASGANPDGLWGSALGVSLAVDSEDNWHVAYYDDPMIKYINKYGATPVTIAGDAGLHSIAIDSNNKLHVVYFVNGNSSIMYVNNVEGFWSSPQGIVSGINNPSGSSLGISLAVDSEDNWHMVYTDFIGYLHNEIKYTTSISDPVTLVNGDVKKPSMALDSDDRPHVIYFTDIHSIKYMNNIEGAWSSPQEIASGLNPPGILSCAFGTSLAIDSQGNWHMVYHDGGNQGIAKYKNKESSPQTLAIDNAWRPAIALDSKDMAHVVCFAGKSSVMYIRQEYCVIALDIKPGSCPNPLDPISRDVLPVAVLGTEEFDVNVVDIASIRLEGVSPIRSSLEDVASPVVDGNECDCTEAGPDGFIDLTLKFRIQQIVEALINAPSELAEGQTLMLSLTGQLYDGTVIAGGDCVVLVGNVPRHLLARVSDVNGDGVINMLDLAKLATYWLESCEVE